MDLQDLDLQDRQPRAAIPLIVSHTLALFLALAAALMTVPMASAAEEPFKGKVAVITGTSSGLGKELATIARDKGMKLVLVDIDLPPSEQMAEAIRDEGGEAIAVKADLAEHDQRVKAVEAAMDRFGRIDYLFNNAGYSYLARLDQMDLEQAHHLFEVNYWAYVDLAEQVIPIMKEQGGGTILNVASILGLIQGSEGLSHYAASKHAVVGMFKTAAAELKPHGIKVFVAAPGGMNTNIDTNSVGPMAQGRGNRTEDWQDPAIPAQDIFEAIQKDQVVFRPGYIGDIPMERLRQ